MANSDTASWVAKLKAQPWFRDVAQTFAQAGIDQSLWESTVYVEDGSLDPAQPHYDPGAGSPGWSYGLFQLRQPGVGSGHTIAELETPQTNAAIAAQRMSDYIKQHGLDGKPLAEQLRGIELAGWNGSLEQDAQRQRVLADIAWANGGSASIPSIGSSDSMATQAGRAIAGAAGSAAGAAGAASGAIAKPVVDAVQGLALQLTIGAVFLALIAGGFAIMASSAAGSVKAPTIIPV